MKYFFHFVTVALLLVPQASAQRAVETASVAPAGGLLILSTTDDELNRSTLFRTVAGADLGVDLHRHFGIQAGYRALGAGTESARHAGFLGTRHTLARDESFGMTIDLGAAAADSPHSGAVAFGPRAGIALELPLNEQLGISLSTSFTGLSREAGGANQRVWDLASETALAIRFRPFAPACHPPDVRALHAPSTLLTHEVGRFTIEVPGGASVIHWTFGDGSSAIGERMDRLFSEPGLHAYRVVIERCGSIAVVEGTLEVSDPCWDPPRARILAVGNALTGPNEPVQFVADVRGTAPLQIQWRFPGGSDTTAAVSLAYAQPGTYPIELEVTNCTERTARARAHLVVTEDTLPAVSIAFAFDRCLATDPPPTDPRFIPLPSQPPPGVDRALSVGDVLNRQALVPFIDALRRHPDHQFLIQGFADVIDADYNVALSTGRAIEVERAVLRIVEAEEPQLLSRPDWFRTVGCGIGDHDEDPEISETMPLAERYPQQRHVRLSIVPTGTGGCTVPEDRGRGVPAARPGQAARECPASVSVQNWE